MTVPRLDRLREMVVRDPKDARARYFLAHELFRAQDWADAAEHLAAFVELSGGDDGAAYKSLGTALARLGRHDEARRAYERGIDSAMAHGHDGLAAELRASIDDLPR